jgi:hypothetical protein
MNSIQKEFAQVRECAELLGCAKAVFNAQTWELLKEISKAERTPSAWLYAAYEVVMPYVLHTTQLQFRGMTYGEWITLSARGNPALVQLWMRIQYHLFPEVTYQTSHQVQLALETEWKISVTSLRKPLVGTMKQEGLQEQRSQI